MHFESRAKTDETADSFRDAGRDCVWWWYLNSQFAQVGAAALGVRQLLAKLRPTACRLMSWIRRMTSGCFR